MAYQRIGSLKSIEEFRDYIDSLGLSLPSDHEILSADEGSPLAAPIDIGGIRVGNRWCVHPMEGWDASDDGKPSSHTIRRWKHFGESGCKLIWGGEAFAVRRDGRANPNQLYYLPDNIEPMRQLFQTLVDAHIRKFGAGADSDMLVGLQLTHSGRFSRPNRKDRLEPRIAYHHPLLDRKFGISPDNDKVVFTDDEVRQLVDDYVVAAKLAHDVGFGFVDVKHCHGYLGHEFLSAYDRPGRYGGDLQGRTQFLREICDGIHTECPGLKIGVRLSIFDQPPYRPAGGAVKGKLGPGEPEAFNGIAYPGFGCLRDNPLEQDLSEPIKLIKMMRDEFGIVTVNLSAGSPYYNPHIQRPAYYPPSDGYEPPEDPLVGCIRQIEAACQIKKNLPGFPLVGTAYSYLQDFLPHVAQALVREGWIDVIGIGRLILSYWDMPADVLEGRGLRRSKKICRTFSDCTTAPRNGIISGCFPLDDHYKGTTEHDALKAAKKQVRKALLADEDSP